LQQIKGFNLERDGERQGGREREREREPFLKPALSLAHYLWCAVLTVTGFPQ
jgi:hypothetical protein